MAMRDRRRWRFGAVAAIAFLVLAAPGAGEFRAAAQPVADMQARTITPGDVAGLTEISDADISPDGRHVLFAMRAGHPDGGGDRSAIWVADAAGRVPARRLTVGTAIDEAPQWSPDGRTIAFMSNRATPNMDGVRGFDLDTATIDGAGPSSDKGSRQLWLMPFTGGEARPVTETGRDIRAFRWAPDGRSIAFLAPDPLTADERADRAARRDWVEVDKPRNPNRIWLLDLSTHALRRIEVADRDVSDLTWSPDGKHLSLRIAATGGLNDYYYRSDLVLLNVASGEVRRTIFRGVYSAGSWSPDGRRLAFVAPEEDRIGIRGFVAEVASGALRQVGDTSEGSLKRLDWSHDNATIIARSIVHTRTVLSRVDAATGRFRPLVDFGGQVRELSISESGTTALIGAQPARAADVWVLRDRALNPVTDVNPQMREWRLGQVEEVRWTSSRDGTPVYGVLVTPPGYVPGTPARTVVQPHGGPEDMWAAGWQGSWTSWAQILAARGYVVLLPNPRGSDGQGTAFARGTKGDWGAGDYQDILDGVDMLVAQGIADPARLGIGGWSYGGFMSAWAITSGDNRFKTAVVGAGVTDLLNIALSTDTPDWFRGYYEAPRASLDRLDRASPLRRVDRAHGPVLVLHGQEDRRVPLTQGLAFYRGLELLGKDAEMVTYPREPHWIGETEHQIDVQQRVLAWFDKHL
jgi:dipeptidyl aminopeptidase/acylaminoacyl peptidase